MYLKADRALSKLYFSFHLKSKRNLVTLEKFNSDLQYYKIELSFSIKLQEINLNVGVEHETKREVRVESMPGRADFLLLLGVQLCFCRFFQKFKALFFKSDYLHRKKIHAFSVWY